MVLEKAIVENGNLVYVYTYDDNIYTFYDPDVLPQMKAGVMDYSEKQIASDDVTMNMYKSFIMGGNGLVYRYKAKNSGKVTDLAITVDDMKSMVSKVQ